MTELIKYVRNIEDKYGRDWYEDEELNLSEDPDWKAILALRQKFEVTPESSNMEHSGSPKFWKEECRVYIKDTLYDLLSKGVTDKSKINRYFGFHPRTRTWLKNVLDYFDMNDFYKECVEKSRRIVLVKGDTTIFFKDAKELAKEVNLTTQDVYWCVKNNKKINGCLVYRYNDFTKRA
ncbi:hypothetical protein [Lactobacillus taiwanensis]|uniref:hypothetical protein n=1 Tax=Lactobacillus taiwanensis TaxID=508451 RepID=UPI00321FE4D2